MYLGCRVVRGPDWEWEDQDGGEGCVGTVVGAAQNEEDSAESTVWVQWDTGARANYRAGLDEKMDLRVYDSSGSEKPVKVNGFTSTCDGCAKNPVIGLLWLCMNCDDYGLCTRCYMGDTHSLDCPFKRIDMTGESVLVGKREEATKVQARGTFSQARVERGPDWRWGAQDGGPGGKGTVVETRSWKNGAKNSVSVKWDRSSKENVYRLGFKGKVDIISTTPATGGFYYRDHLPGLRIRAKKTVSGFTTEDKVKVNVTKEQLMELAEGHGGWTEDMEKCIPKIGDVHDFTKSGDVIVDYDGEKFRFAPQALAKVPHYKKGDKVLVSEDMNLVEKLQDGHGGWNHRMKAMLGKIGTVKKVESDNNVVIKVDNDIWMVNAAILTLHEAAADGEVEEDSDDDDEHPLQALFKQHALQKLLTDAFSEMFTGEGKTQKEDDEGLALVQAAANGHVSRVTQALDERPELLNYKSSLLEKTCLHMACHSGYCDIIQLLLEKNADISIKDGQGYTAIHHAAYGDKTGEAMKLMIAHGVDPNIADNDTKCTPLHLAVKESNDNAVRILVQTATCDVNLQDVVGETPLHDAISKRNNNILDLILDAPKINLTLKNKSGFNFLHLAAYKGNSYAARKLLAKSPELVNVPKEDGFTSLHLAAVNDHCDIAEIILAQNDCKVDCRTKNNQTPLMLAVHEGYLKMVKIFEQHGADVNAADEDGDTPLHVSLMREKFFSVGMGSLLGLFGKSTSSYTEISRYLISHGANVRQPNQAGKTPMEYGEGTKAEPDLRKAFEETKVKEEKKPTGSEKMNIVNNFASKKEEDTVQARELMEVNQEISENQTVTRSIDGFKNAQTLEAKNVKTEEGGTSKEDSQQKMSGKQVEEEEEFQNGTSSPVKKTKRSCLICIDGEADVVFKPCGHTVLCKGCSVRAKRCPECKQLVMNKTTEDGKKVPPKVEKEDLDAKEKLQSTEKKLKKLEEMVTCCVCLERKKNIIFSCGHGACQVCAEHLSVCAICKKEIQKKIAIFRQFIVSQNKVLPELKDYNHSKGMYLGCRVVRGPDWEWEDQDGGEGCVGTVVEAAQNEEDSVESTVWVQWDTGARANYRAGLDEKMDLRVYDSSGAASSAGKHILVMCDGCNQQPVLGIRWKCMTCDNYDLCTSCYMADTHDLECVFSRMEYQNGQRVPVGKREGATKIQARGTFSGARVERGPDWRWGAQDGGPGGKGTVVETRSWKNGAKNSVSVKWDRSNKENVYRLGFKGKVDILSTTPETGGFYYRDHLPGLRVRAKKTARQSQDKDKVKVNVTKDELMELAEGHGGWNDDMEKYIQKIGVVHDFTKSGDVIVDYDGTKFRFAPQALAKIRHYKAGDKVLVSEDMDMVKKLQDGHGGWNHRMKTMLGKIGTVKKVDSDNDVIIKVDDKTWMVNAAILTLHEAAADGEVEEDSDDDDEDPLQALLKQHALKKLLADAVLTDVFSGMFTGNEKKQKEDDEGLALVQAAAHGHLSHVTRVNYKSSLIEKTCLHHACHSGYCDIIQLLLEKNADTSIKDGQGYTAIHHAAYGDKSGEAMKLMIAHGVDPNIAEKDTKCTPLHLAVKESNDNAVRILVQTATCDVNLQDVIGETPLHHAISKRNNNILDLILDAPKINLTLKNKSGFNFLHLAAYKGNSYATRKLLAKSPELVNVPKEDGFTSLHLAAVNDHCDIAEIILAQDDCKVDCRTKNDQTPLMLAVHEGYLKMVKILEQHGADVNAVDEDGDTPLHVSLMREKIRIGSLLGLFGKSTSSYTEISRYLISHGANVRQPNQAGKTPMEYGEGTKAEPDLKKAFEETKVKEEKKPTGSEKMNIVNNFASKKEEDTAQASEPTATRSIDGFKNAQTLEAKKVKTERTCLICIDGEADVVFKPCGHTVLCKGCSVRAKRCPECKQPVMNKTTEDGKKVPPKVEKEDMDAKEKLQSTEKKLKKLEEMVTCCVCLERKKNIIFSCGHGACQVCAEHLSVCAICKKEIQKKIAIF
ncbi:uncharacterized protein LOC116300724 [Actinia tenebrosa]|uniref:RING-type E3 ubiquitin transferase n=1 Tax=Actinia tenebrosa TaxID=6105 RepID=A0A6P8IFH1_ACTTE|nr:uncharacterized protein LOC116300724 [Actinia tenebrosa]